MGHPIVKLLSTSTWRQGAKIASIASASVPASMSRDSVLSEHLGADQSEGLGDELRLPAREVALEGPARTVGMGNDLAKADAVNTALAN